MASDVPAQLRERVARRASYRCEYCRIHDSDSGYLHQVDHIVSRKHGGSSDFQNLAYACVLCNRYKGSDVASINTTTGEAVRLFHPRQDRWTDHFRFDSELIEPLTPEGKATLLLLRLNSKERIIERKLHRWLTNPPN